MQLSILHIASLITIFQSLLLIVFLLNRKRGSSQSEKILAAFLITFVILIYSSFVMSTELAARKTHLILAAVTNQFIFIVGPLFYFYLKSFFTREFTFTKKDLFHFIPFFVLLISSIIAIPTLNIKLLFKTIFPYINGCICVHIFIYIILSMQFMKKQGLIIGDLSSYLRIPKLSWIVFLFIGLIMVWLFKLIIFFGWNIAGITRWCQFMTTTFFMTTFVFINPIVYIALKKPELFSRKEKYDQSSLCDAKKQEYLNRLQNFMRSSKPHLQSTISLPDLARRLSIPRHHLSQVINESFNLNFNDFINKYRIDDALALLQDRSNHNGTILEIAYQVGFNSKSTFNSAFKKHTGQTPKEYKNNGHGHHAVVHDRRVM
ncbi:MAG: AraC family transcriptional regulator [bacterium]